MLALTYAKKQECAQNWMKQLVKSSMESFFGVKRRRRKGCWRLKSEHTATISTHALQYGVPLSEMYLTNEKINLCHHLALILSFCYKKRQKERESFCVDVETEGIPRERKKDVCLGSIYGGREKKVLSKSFVQTNML